MNLVPLTVPFSYTPSANASQRMSEFPPFRAVDEMITTFLLICFFLSEFFDDFCRDARDKGMRGHIFRDYRASTDDCTFADYHAGADCDPSAKPDLVADFHRLWNHPTAFLRVGIVVQCGDDRLRAD